MKDRLISTKELEKGLWMDDIQILPPLSEDTQSQIRHKRKIKYRKVAGRVYYQLSSLIKFAEANDVEAAS